MLIAINERVVLVLCYAPKHLDICFFTMHHDGDRVCGGVWRGIDGCIDWC